MDATTAGSSFHDSALPILGLLGGLWFTWRYWKAAHAHATRRNAVWAKFSHLFGALVGGLAFVFWYVALIITVYPAHWYRLWFPWGFSVVTMVVAWRWLNSNKVHAPAAGTVPPVPTPVATDAPAPSVPLKVVAPIDHDQVRRDAEAQRALDAVRLPPPPYPYSAPAPRKRAPAKPVARIESIHLPDRVQFTYMNNEGEIRDRTVRVNQVNRSGHKFTGYCETARGVRTFHVSSVIGSVTRHETGEIVSPESWYKALRSKDGRP